MLSAFRAWIAAFPLPAVALLATLGSAVPLVGQSTYAPWQFSTIAGQSGVKGGSEDGPGATALFSQPQGIAVDIAGNVYVADTYNQTIRKITPSGNVTTLAGTVGSGGHADGVGPAASFNYPQGVAVDSAGNVYVADTQNSLIRKVTPVGAVTTIAGGAAKYADGTGTAAGFNSPSGIAVDAAGNLYVADTGHDAIRKITPDGAVTTLAGDPASIPPGGADGTGAAARFGSPHGLAVDGAGNVFVTDTANDTIRRVSSAGVVTTVAGAAGNAGTMDATGGAARFNAPTGVAVGADGTLYICDAGNTTIRLVYPTGAVLTLAGGPGQVYVGSSGIGPAARFRNAAALAVAPNGAVYVADSQDNTIRRGGPVGPSTATVLLGNLTQVYDGYVQPVSVTTIPAGLPTSITYSGGSLDLSGQPNAEGTYGVFATVTNATGYANAVLTVEPGPAAQPAFTVRHSNPGGSSLWAITYGPSGFVTVGTGGAILTSRDGSTWTARASGTNAWLVGVTFGGNQYVAVGDSGTVLVSPDGATWTPVAQSATTERLNNVTYGAGVYVAVGEGGTIISSPDARTWTARASGVTGWLRGLAWVEENDLSAAILPRVFSAGFIATGEGGAILLSPDGITWTNDGLGNGLGAPWIAGQNIEAIAAATGQVVGVGDNGALDFSEVKFASFFPYEDLNTSAFFAPITYRAVVKGPGSIFAAGDKGTILTGGAFAGANWYQVPSGTTADLAGGIAIGSSVYFVGADETIVQVSTPSDSRLVNLSCRTQVGTGANVLIAGFVLAGGSPNGATPMLIRGSGPALAAFDVPGALPDLDLDLFGTSSGGTLLASNTGWGGSPAVVSTAAEVGAFAWTDPSSHDDALLQVLPAGSYTANLSGQSGDTGVALAEIYDATPTGAPAPGSPHLVNLAARAQVGTGSNILIAGFVVGGTTPMQLLIRASGPALVPFGVAGTLPDPVLKVYNSVITNAPLATDTGWGGESAIASTAALVGAFPWSGSSTDSALLLTLYPGAYTAQVAGASGDSGVALIEVYEVP